jgi:hypothetical protein
MALYPLILPIFAIIPWWAFAKFVLKLTMPEYRNFGYFIFLTFFATGIAITIWKTKAVNQKKEEILP